MFNANIRGCIEIGNSARNLEYPVVSTGGKPQPVNGGFQKCAGRSIRSTEFSDLTAGHLGIAIHRKLRKPLGLYGPSRGNPASNCGRRLFEATAHQVLVGDGRHIDMNVDPVQKGPGNLGTIFVDLLGRAAAFVLGIREITAGTGVHGCNQHEAGTTVEMTTENGPSVIIEF